jgi:hypothetical protein
MGLSVSATEDSMRQADVQQSISHGVIVGPLRYRPREMVVTALAVAADEEGMSEGLAFLRGHYEGSGAQQCGGTENLWFLNVCPSCSDNFIVPDGQTPPAAMTQADCYACFDAQARHYRGARVTQGPIVLRKTPLPSGGVIAEIEFTIIVSDPNEYTGVLDLFNGPVTVTGEAVYDPAPAPPIMDAIDARLGYTRAAAAPRVSVPDEWTRYEMPLPDVPVIGSLDTVVYTYEVHAAADFDELRVGVAEGQFVVDGFEVPFLPDGYDIVVDNRTHEVLVGNSVHVVNRIGFANAFYGGAPYLPNVTVSRHDGTRTLVVDVAGTGHDIANLHVTVKATAKGSA